MLVEVGGEKVVSWAHEIEFDREQLTQGADEKTLKALSLSVGRTICTIKDPQGSFEVQGVTYRSRLDAFDHLKGMRESLTKALMPNFCRAERKVFWDKFWEMKKEGMRLVVGCV